MDLVEMEKVLKKKIWPWILQHTSNFSDAEDAWQDVRLAAWRQRDQDVKSIEAYLRVIARRCLISKRALNTFPLDDFEEQLQEKKPGPYETLEEKERLTLLRRCIWQLDEPYRVAFIERLKGYELSEIADKMKVSKQSVKNWIYRSVSKIAKCLEGGAGERKDKKD